MKMWLLITLWVIVLILNAVYSFLPGRLQSTSWVRVCAILAAVVILVHGVYEVIQTHRSRIVAHVSRDGTILNSKNFPWKISKTMTKEGEIVYIINERFGDASQVSIVTNDKNAKYTIYNAIDGVAIKFQVPEKQIPNFEIAIKN